MNEPGRHRYVSTDRRVREDRRFVAGKGKFVADIDLPNTKHVAVVTCPHAAARIKNIDKSAALKMPGVHYVVDGAELATATLPLMTGLDTPNVPRRPLALDVARYSGEWVAAVVADSRALAEDAAEAIEIDYEPLPFVLDAEQALEKSSPLVHEAHGSNVLLDKTFVWGEVDKDFAAAPRKLSLRVKWGRSSTVPIETFGVVASWDPWREMLDVYASIQMPRYADQIGVALKIPVHLGARALRRRCRRQLRRQARHQAHGAVRLSGAAARFSDPADRGPAGKHARRRRARAGAAVRCRSRVRRQGIVRSMKMRALENVGAYAGRSPFQLGKPIGAIVGPYKINSVQYRAIAVVTNKTTKTRCAASARARPIWRLSAAWTRSPMCSASIRSRCAGAT